MLLKMRFFYVFVLFVHQWWLCFCIRDLPTGVYHISLDPSGNISMFWSVDYDRESIKFEIHAPLRKWDWFAVGFSDYGEFYPADYCILWTNWNRNVQFEDAWADEDADIYIDPQQDCKDFDVSYLQPTRAVFTFSRKFDTCDDYDYIVEDGTTHIVWLKGNGPVKTIGNLNVYYAVDKGMQRAQLLKNEKIPDQKILHHKSTRVLEFKGKRVKVPPADTTYWCSVSKLPDYLVNIHHIIQFEAIIQSGNEGLVHHMELFHCEAAPHVVISSYDGPCFDKTRPKNTEVCKKVLAAWAMGATPFLYPEVAGLPIGGESFNKYVMLETHYNNPEEKSDYVDSSGMRLYVTSLMRKYSAGVIELGLEYIDKMALPPKQKSFSLSGYCISECTDVSIPPTGITIFGSQLHTHLTGVQVVTRHVRNGRELPNLNRDNHYSTHFQEIRLLKRPVQVLPGDALITTCRYNTEGRDNVTLGGFAIRDEMCVNYVHYYPRIQLEVCKSSISYQTLFTYFHYMNEWHSQNTSLEYGISTNYKNIEWTADKAEELHKLYEESTLSMQCNASTGLRFPGDWENVPLSRVSYPLPPPLRSCKEKLLP